MDLMRFRDNNQWKLLNAKNGVFYLEDTSNNSNYKVNIIDDIELFPGFTVNLKVNTDNSGESTFSIDNGVTNIDIVKGINAPTETGDINAFQIINLVYDGAKWRLKSPELLNHQKRFFSSFTAVANNTTTCPINHSMFNKDDSTLDIIYEGALLLEGVNFDIATSGEDVDLNFSIDIGERLDYIITKNMVSTLSGSYVDPVDRAGDVMTGNLTAPVVISNVADGTSPLQVTSTTKVANLNADRLDGRHIYELDQFNVYRSNKDSEGIFTQVDYKRYDDTLFVRSVLSGGTSPEYTTRTATYYAEDGTTVVSTKVYTISYDVDGDITSEVSS